MTTAPSTTLLVVASNPPLTPGTRTENRIELVRQILDFDEARLANLFSVPTRQTGDVTQVGSEPQGWLAARPHLEDGLQQASAVLLAYGVGKPSGPAREHHSAQVMWLEERIAHLDVPVWLVGGKTRHPSRWQRHTYRAFPGEPFRGALERSLELRVGDLSAP